MPRGNIASSQPGRRGGRGPLEGAFIGRHHSLILDRGNAPVWGTLVGVSRIRARSRFARLAPRLVFAGIFAAAIVSGAAAGCGIDFEGQLVHDVGLDGSENVGANVPEGSADAMGDGSSTDAGLDADGDAAPALKCTDSRCVDAGGVCTLATNECTFHCDGGSNCDAGLTCPPGVPCHVVCAADNICAGKIDCTQASSCDIACLGAHTCEGVACSGTSCNVQCSGMDSCQTGGISCEAGTCNIACNAVGGMKNCKDRVTCQASVGCSVVCDKDGCPGGVTAIAPDASILCGDNACVGGETCFASYCALGCQSGGCSGNLCCEAGTCVVEGGANKCP